MPPTAAIAAMAGCAGPLTPLQGSERIRVVVTSAQPCPVNSIDPVHAMCRTDRPQVALLMRLPGMLTWLVYAHPQPPVGGLAQPQPTERTLTEPADPFDFQRCVHACAAGDRRALHALYDHEGARLLGVARRITRDTASAEDVLHDGFVRIWTRAASFDAARGSARGWIYSIIRHLALNHVRDGLRDLPLDEAQLSALLASADHEQALDAHAASARLYHCLDALEPARRACVLHAYVEGCSHGQIAQLLGAPLGTVKAWIKRSLAALRECMG